MLRRSFFAGAAGATGLALSSQGAEKSVDIPKRTFGKTGEKLTIIGQAGGRFPMCTFDDAKAITQRAYDLGVNYFDTARIYWSGRSEEVYGEVLAAGAGRRSS